MNEQDLGSVFTDSQVKRDFQAQGTIQTVGIYTVFVAVDSMTAADLYRAANEGSTLQGSDLIKISIFFNPDLVQYVAYPQITSMGKDESDVQVATAHHGLETRTFDGIAKTTSMEGDPYNTFETFGSNSKTDLVSTISPFVFVANYWGMITPR